MMKGSIFCDLIMLNKSGHLQCQHFPPIGTEGSHQCGWCKGGEWAPLFMRHIQLHCVGDVSKFESSAHWRVSNPEAEFPPGWMLLLLLPLLLEWIMQIRERGETWIHISEFKTSYFWWFPDWSTNEQAWTIHYIPVWCAPVLAEFILCIGSFLDLGYWHYSFTFSCYSLDYSLWI